MTKEKILGTVLGLAERLKANNNATEAQVAHLETHVVQKVGLKGEMAENRAVEQELFNLANAQESSTEDAPAEQTEEAPIAPAAVAGSVAIPVGDSGTVPLEPTPLTPTAEPVPVDAPDSPATRRSRREQ